MKILRYLASLLALAAAHPATAQNDAQDSSQHSHISLYAGLSVPHVSNADRGNAAAYPNPISEQYDSFWKPTEGGGATAHLVNIGPTALGLDLRGAGINNLVNSYLGEPNGYQGEGYELLGLQFAYRKPKQIRPYAQFSYGGFSTFADAAAPNSTSSYNQTYLGYEVFAGIDYHLIRFVDFRAVEIGAGNAFHRGNINGVAINNLTVFNIDTGILVHF